MIAQWRSSLYERALELGHFGCEKTMTRIEIPVVVKSRP